MIQVTINDLNNVLIAGGTFSDQPTADAWIAANWPISSNYTATSTDITAQVALQAAIQAGLEAQAFGAQIIAQTYAYNEANLGSGALTPTLFTTMLSDSTMANIERLLWNGSLKTALALINSYNATLLTYFSSDQISAITSAITAYIA